MSRKTTDYSGQSIEWRSHCPVSCALDVLGDKWSLLIVRDLILHGTRTYTQFREGPEQISTNILANRLKLLVEVSIIMRTDPDGFARGNAYKLTGSGAALKPILLAYGKWANTHLKVFNEHMVDM